MLTSKEDREKAIEGLRKLRRPFPPGFKFDREEAHERGADIPEDERERPEQSQERPKDR